jgi:rRNA maturation protein Nop10
MPYLSFFKKTGDYQMLLLKKCPECGSKLENDIFRDYQYCPVCGYWTKKETLRIEPLMILE